MGNQVICLNDGSFLYNDYGKYRPNLTFLFKDDSKFHTVTYDCKLGTVYAEEVEQKVKAHAYKILSDKIYQKETSLYIDEKTNEWVRGPVDFREVKISYVTEGVDITRFSEKNYRENLNFSVDGSIGCKIIGDFFVSKKGKDCFRIKPDGKHMLLCIDWGGCFNSSRGYLEDDVERDCLYNRRASSNGGGTGNTWIVLPVNWKRKVTEEDLI